MHETYRRGLGLICPIFSLPSPHGIGTFGEAAYRFCDWLSEQGIRYWQILPLGQTGYGDSPYASYSSCAGNPYFIDPELLVEAGLLTRRQLEASDAQCAWNAECVEYAKLYRARFSLLRSAYAAFRHRTDDEERARFSAFCEAQKAWLSDYACFMALKEHHHGRPWFEWVPAYKHREQDQLRAFSAAHAEELNFWRFVQYLFDGQWQALKAHAAERDIVIIGDLPIYAAYDSVEVWCSPQWFCLNEQLERTAVSGAPPDAYSADGQLWGNPLYRWQELQADGYRYWIERIRYQFRLYHMLRLDHFIGFTQFWSVPADAPSAAAGHWAEGPGRPLFDALSGALGELPILVEDLGQLSEAVIRLRDDLGFPGMNPIQFAFDSSMASPYLPHNYERSTSAYASTHDSDTVLGWLNAQEEAMLSRIRRYFGVADDAPLQTLLWAILRGLAASPASLVLFQVQDILELGSSSRINRPGFLGGNWQWRMAPEALDGVDTETLRQLVFLYGRNE